MEKRVLKKKNASKPNTKPTIKDDFLLIRWLILTAGTFAMLGYAHLLPTLLSDLFYNLEQYSKFLGRFSFFSMLFLQIVYIFGVNPEISGREKGPKGDTAYLLSYICITLYPIVSTLFFGLLSPFLIYLNHYYSTLAVLYLVAILPAILLLECLVRWRLRAYFLKK
ncbi:hypothetical protein [Aureispira anguillae]|uniref:Uncharacterized protein n=1 Tax=Aureispira anguillae TaxID=2864201 RepID=A0A915YK99_9BACT|nr:hypothetical protein [Aureispira anguillae]BDS14569.1 hypothetical protein AsAng_0053500 [Aureispira anguillae]